MLCTSLLTPLGVTLRGLDLTYAKKIRVGMTEEEVVKTMGGVKPTHRYRNSFYYVSQRGNVLGDTRYDSVQIDLKEGRVKKVTKKKGKVGGVTKKIREAKAPQMLRVPSRIDKLIGCPRERGAE